MIAVNEVELVPFVGWLEEDGGDGGGQKDHLESHLPCTKTRQSSTSEKTLPMNGTANNVCPFPVAKSSGCCLKVVVKLKFYQDFKAC